MQVSREHIHCKSSYFPVVSLFDLVCRSSVFRAAINLILDLKSYDVRPMLLSGLVALLKPLAEEVDPHEITQGDTLVWMFVTCPVVS